jgi:2-polyprenyl-3-methyl-5-hydroxy-6-metoxy-1,4-benzoquinol methylase
MRGIGLAMRYFNNLRILALGYAPERIRRVQWEESFESGSYERLESIPERARYSLIVGHCDVLNVRSILDVGCGQGVLAKRLARVGYERYLGYDLSETAIDQARRNVPDPRNGFVTGEADGFETPAQFDLIVFNECLYYLDDPAAVMRRHLRFLAPGGHVTVSMHDTLRSRALWPVLSMLTAIDSVEVRFEGHASWTVKLMRPAVPVVGD